MTTIADIITQKLGRQEVQKLASTINQIVANAPMQRQERKNIAKVGRRKDGKLIQPLKQVK